MRVHNFGHRLGQVLVKLGRRSDSDICVSSDSDICVSRLDWGRCSSSLDDANLLGIAGAWVGQSLSGQACDFSLREHR